MARAAVCSPRDPMLKKREDFEDILEERRTTSDLRYALRCYAPVLYQGHAPCRAAELKSLVLQSDHLHYVIQQVSRETGSSLQDVQGEAAAILEEMAHRLQLGTVRFFAFTLSKAFKALFRSIHVNEEGIQRLQQAIHQHPVVLLPSHRSYLDFLLMSYILYSYDVALPVIAAGMDFLGMRFVGEMLRMSGAFFIRRSFGGDRLYWAVFSQYVKTMLKTGFAPVEFFLEGTRSRTCKSLTPKLGLLNIVMEPFLQGEVYDISLVPVSISYERILEESLYARELLGVPKPKESTSGLFKARSVLSEDYGSIHVYFGQPVSVRGLAEGRINRSQFNLIPRHMPRRPGDDVYSLVNDSAYRLLRAQEENMVLRPWVLLACLLLQNHHQNLDQNQHQHLHLEQLTEEALWLRDLSRHYGAFLDWPDHVRPSLVVSSSLSLHPGLVRVCQGRVQLNFGQGFYQNLVTNQVFKQGDVENLQPSSPPGPGLHNPTLDRLRFATTGPGSTGPGSTGPGLTGPDPTGPGSTGPGSTGPGPTGPGLGLEEGERRPAVSPEEALLSQAVVELSCASYRNQALHVFVRPALLAWALHNTATSRKEELFSSFSFLRNLFSNEFALRPGAAVQDYEEACYLLVKTGDLLLTQQDVMVTERGRHTLTFLTNLIQPFLQGYQLVCRFLCEEPTEAPTEKLFVPAVRKFIIRLLLTGQASHSEMLSSDLQKNALAALLRLGVVDKVNGGEEAGRLKVNQVKLTSLEGSLRGERPSPNAAAARL